MSDYHKEKLDLHHPAEPAESKDSVFNIKAENYSHH